MLAMGEQIPPWHRVLAHRSNRHRLIQYQVEAARFAGMGKKQANEDI